MFKHLKESLSTLRRIKPLVLNLTNYVTMDFMANSLLSLGAAPIMSHCDDELDELIQMAHSININLGTLDDAFITRIKKAVKLAKKYQKPLILDPVGAGASAIRTNTARELMPYVDIVRGNASEIMALSDNQIKTLGVETLQETDAAKSKARVLAKEYGLTVVISGRIDCIISNTNEITLPFGSPLMSLITGMGCTLTAVIAAFRGILSDSFISATLATCYFGLCGNMAANKTKEPGTYHSAFIDALYTTDFSLIVKQYAEHDYAIQMPINCGF